MKGFIGDGHDVTFYIQGVAGLYEDCKIHGRLMPCFDSTAVQNDGTMLKARTAGSGGEAEAKFYTDKIISRITAWEYLDADAVGSDGRNSPTWKPFDDENGRTLPVTPKTFHGLCPKLGWRIRDIIMGNEAADVDPATKRSVPSENESTKNSVPGSG